MGQIWGSIFGGISITSCTRMNIKWWGFQLERLYFCKLYFVFFANCIFANYWIENAFSWRGWLRTSNFSSTQPTLLTRFRWYLTFTSYQISNINGWVEDKYKWKVMKPIYTLPPYLIIVSHASHGVSVKILKWGELFHMECERALV